MNQCEVSYRRACQPHELWAFCFMTSLSLKLSPSAVIISQVDFYASYNSREKDNLQYIPILEERRSETPINQTSNTTTTPTRPATSDQRSGRPAAAPVKAIGLLDGDIPYADPEGPAIVVLLAGTFILPSPPNIAHKGPIVTLPPHGAAGGATQLFRYAPRVPTPIPVMLTISGVKAGVSMVLLEGKTTGFPWDPM